MVNISHSPEPGRRLEIPEDKMIINEVLWHSTATDSDEFRNFTILLIKWFVAANRFDGGLANVRHVA